MSDETGEFAYTLARIQAELEDLAVGGLRVAGPERVPIIEALREDLEKVGAASLAGSLETLATAIREGQREAGAALMRAQAGLRLFDRLLTLDLAAARLAALAGENDDADSRTDSGEKGEP